MLLKNLGSAFRRPNGALVQRGHMFAPTDAELAEIQRLGYIGKAYAVEDEAPDTGPVGYIDPPADTENEGTLDDDGALNSAPSVEVHLDVSMDGTPALTDAIKTHAGHFGKKRRRRGH